MSYHIDHRIFWIDLIKQRHARSFMFLFDHEEHNTSFHIDRNIYNFISVFIVFWHVSSFIGALVLSEKDWNFECFTSSSHKYSKKKIYSRRFFQENFFFDVWTWLCRLKLDRQRLIGQSMSRIDNRFHHRNFRSRCSMQINSVLIYRFLVFVRAFIVNLYAKTIRLLFSLFFLKFSS